MTHNREALEDAFTRAEGAHEVAFRRYMKAKRQEHIAGWVAEGKRTHAALEAAALDLSTYRKDAGK